MDGLRRQRMNESVVYTVTVLDVMGDPILGQRRTPAIFTTAAAAFHAVRNNEGDLADNNLYQYAVIERTYLDEVRPQLQNDTTKWWFKYNTVLEEFEPCSASAVPPRIARLTGFGIG